MFSPSIVAPSPMKKKLSLSDYTNRKKKIEGAQQQQQQQRAAQGSPLAHTTFVSNNNVPFKDSPKEEKSDALTGPSTASTGPNGSQAAVESEPAADHKTHSLALLPAHDSLAGSVSISAPAAESTAMDIDRPSKPPDDDVKAKTTGWWNAW